MQWTEMDIKIPVHTFFAASNEVVAGAVTRAAVKSYFGMDAATATEYDLLANLAPGSAAAQALYVSRVHSVFILAEDRVPGYDTPAAIRAKLGI